MIEVENIRTKLQLELDLLIPQLEALDPESTQHLNPEVKLRLDKVNEELEEISSQLRAAKSQFQSSEEKATSLEYRINTAIPAEIKRLRSTMEDNNESIIKTNNAIGKAKSNFSSIPFWQEDIKEAKAAKAKHVAEAEPVLASIENSKRVILNHANVEKKFTATENSLTE